MREPQVSGGADSGLCAGPEGRAPLVAEPPPLATDHGDRVLVDEAADHRGPGHVHLAKHEPETIRIHRLEGVLAQRTGVTELVGGAPGVVELDDEDRGRGGAVARTLAHLPGPTERGGDGPRRGHRQRDRGGPRRGGAGHGTARPGLRRAGGQDGREGKERQGAAPKGDVTVGHGEVFSMVSVLAQRQNLPVQ